MKKKVKETFCSILVVVFTAVLFFLLGMSATHLLGQNNFTPTKIIYVTETVTTTTTTATLPTASDGRLNINLATKEELMTINDIGEKTATKIIEYRNKYGPFSSLEQLLEIDDIGNKSLEKWRPYLTVE